MAAIEIIIETPKGYTRKYELRQSTYVLDRKLPKGMAFPENYGFIPDTKAEDLDELDVVYIAKKVPPRSRLKAQVIGIIYMTDAGKEDNKILCIPENSKKSLKSMDKKVKELVQFIATYKPKIEVSGVGDKQKALKAIKMAKI